MSHRAVSACAVLTKQIARETAKLEADCAASELKFVGMLESAQEAIAYSRDLLSKLNAARDGCALLHTTLGDAPCPNPPSPASPPAPPLHLEPVAPWGRIRTLVT